MKNTFKQHPRIKTYFQTTDGVKFFRQSDAKNHAKTLDDKNVTEVKKGQSEKADKGSNKTSAKKTTAKGTDEGAKKLTPMQEAKNRKTAIEALDTVEAVEKALEGETAKTVKDAGAKRIEAIKAATGSSDEEE